jgi:hypothetical protein
MDITTILITVLFLALFLLPFFYSRSKRLGRNKALVNALQSLAASSGYTLSRYDTWVDSAIGLDADRRGLAFVRLEDGQVAESYTVNLRDMADCSVQNSAHESSGADKKKVVDKLLLRLSPRNANAAPVLIPFYEASRTFVLLNELQLAEAWSRLIKEKLK